MALFSAFKITHERRPCLGCSLLFWKWKCSGSMSALLSSVLSKSAATSLSFLFKTKKRKIYVLSAPVLSKTIWAPPKCALAFFFFFFLKSTVLPLDSLLKIWKGYGLCLVCFLLLNPQCWQWCLFWLLFSHLDQNSSFCIYLKVTVLAWMCLVGSLFLSKI